MFLSRGLATAVVRTVIAGCVIALSSSPVIAWDEGEEPPEIPRKEFSPNSACRVVRVVECDTIVILLEGKQTRVGLIGVVAPAEPRERDLARDFAANLLLREQVYVDREEGWPEKDASGRVWAYLYRAPDGLLINLELVRRGYARIGAAQPYQLDDAMRYYQQRARAARKGIWGMNDAGDESDPSAASSAHAAKTTGTRNPTTRLAAEAPRSAGGANNGGAQPPSESASVTVYITKTGKKYHREGCEHLKKSSTPIALEDAKAKGLEPCQSCDPPP